MKKLNFPLTTKINYLLFRYVKILQFKTTLKKFFPTLILFSVLSFNFSRYMDAKASGVGIYKKFSEWYTFFLYTIHFWPSPRKLFKLFKSENFYLNIQTF